MASGTKVTIGDVAEAAGVSPATVSLVYNEKGAVAPATRRRVLAIGDRLGYRPGWLSKAFRSGRTHVIGVAVVHGASPLWEQTYLSYYRGIIAGAAMEALQHRYSIAAVSVEGAEGIDGPLPMDGVIVVDPAPDDPVVRHALDEGMAVVAEGGYGGDAGGGRIATVRSDVESGVPAALDALVAGGARRPAFLRGAANDGYTTESENAYTAWCRARGIPPLAFVLTPDETPIDGARRFLAAHRGAVDAVYCINGAYGGAVVAAAAEAECAIPDELAVALAGEPGAAIIDPRLIYLDLDPVRSGAECARVLIEMLEGGEPRSVLLPMALTAPGSR